MSDEEAENLYESSDCLEDAFEGLLSGCLNCGVCESCIERSIAAAEYPPDGVIDERCDNW